MHQTLNSLIIVFALCFLKSPSFETTANDKLHSVGAYNMSVKYAGYSDEKHHKNSRLTHVSWSMMSEFSYFYYYLVL